MSTAPSRLQMSRQTLLPAMAAHVLEHGLSGASLRPLAKAAGTSDRMLIYHFGNKEALIDEVLAFIAQTYASALDAAMSGVSDGGRAATRQQVIARILAKSREPEMQAFLVLWWDIVAGSARGHAGYAEAAQRVISELLAWLETQMPVNDPDPVGGSRYLLTLIEGAQMLSAVGHARTAREGLIAAELEPDLAGDESGD